MHTIISFVLSDIARCAYHSMRFELNSVFNLINQIMISMYIIFCGQLASLKEI